MDLEVEKTACPPSVGITRKAAGGTEWMSLLSVDADLASQLSLFESEVVKRNVSNDKLEVEHDHSVQRNDLSYTSRISDPDEVEEKIVSEMVEKSKGLFCSTCHFSMEDRKTQVSSC